MDEQIVEQLIDSIGKYENGDPFNVVHFTVTAFQGRNYLYRGTPLHGKKIAECVNGDYVERYGSIKKWLEHIIKREQNRIDTIKCAMDDLKNEFDERSKLINAIKECGVK